MKLVMTLVARDAVDIVDAQIAYHLNAGVDLVIATDHDSQDGTTEILETYEREGYLHLIRERGEMRESQWRTQMAHLAATAYGADWAFDASNGEFYWPRAESLKAVLTPVPPRYTVVQALVRTFVPKVGGQQFFADRMTIRRSVASPGGGSKSELARQLRPVYRTDPRHLASAAGSDADPRQVPLRAWYPIEVLQFPVCSADDGSAPAVDDEQVDRGLADGSLIVDSRLRESLHRLRESGAGSDRRFALPAEGASRLTFAVPDIVEDAAYAVECAVLGEVDFAPLERLIEDLDLRIAALEARFWQRVFRRLSRAGRRSAP